VSTALPPSQFVALEPEAFMPVVIPPGALDPTRQAAGAAARPTGAPADRSAPLIIDFPATRTAESRPNPVLANVPGSTAQPTVVPRPSPVVARTRAAPTPTATHRPAPTPKPTPKPTPTPTPTPTPAGHSVSGRASWYCLTGVSRCSASYPGGMYAAAGPALRVGAWRGRTVRVCAAGTCISVRLIDTCACGGTRVMDLYGDAFRLLTPLSTGTVTVHVRW
jgi:rare lipoprotein A (peptidoglycan hydrolase)